MASKLSIYNGALQHLGERKLASLTENRDPRRVLDAVWDGDGAVACLERGLWNFAMRTAEVTYTPDITPAFGYTRAFDKPDDHVRTAGLCSDEFLKVPLLEYRDEAGYWFADLDTIYVSYVSKDTGYGLDYARWPQSFTRYVECYFAQQACIRITGDKARRDDLEAEAKRLLTAAQSMDAMENPTQAIPPGTWSRARTGNRSRRDRGTRSGLIG